MLVNNMSKDLFIFKYTNRYIRKAERLKAVAGHKFIPGGGGSLGNSLWGLRSGSPNPDGVSDQKMPFFTSAVILLASKLHTRFYTEIVQKLPENPTHLGGTFVFK